MSSMTGVVIESLAKSKKKHSATYGKSSVTSEDGTAATPNPPSITARSEHVQKEEPLRYIVKEVPNNAGAPLFQVFDTGEGGPAGHPEFWRDKAEHLRDRLNAQDRELEQVADESRYQ